VLTALTCATIARTARGTGRGVDVGAAEGLPERVPSAAGRTQVDQALRDTLAIAS
jgi:hypothetical protein